ncbi:hypothetical protein RND71_026380 [Anisodus tanguticus]|uniref:Uncharacterized protein n=1 Tax=Anisodus tanguticus TaxID=243964 RepID=A0AAE1RNG2_9SOLA|nr:hypothetical protein RND71_026380 [Anisodus tanguticus]
MKAELRKLKSETQRKEDLLYLDTLLTEDMNSLINDQALKIQQFQNMPLMEAFRCFPAPVEITHATNAAISAASSIAGDSITIPAIAVETAPATRHSWIAHFLENCTLR